MEFCFLVHVWRVSDDKPSLKCPDHHGIYTQSYRLNVLEHLGKGYIKTGSDFAANQVLPTPQFTWVKSFLICIYGWWLILVPILVLFTFNLSVKKKRMFRRQLWPVHVPHHGIRQLEWCYFGFLGMTVFWYHDKPSFYWCQFAGLCFEIISTLCFTENKKVG